MSSSIIDFPWRHLHVTGTVQVSPCACALHSIVVNGLTTAGDATVYDDPAAAGTVIAVLHLDPTTSVSVQPITFLYDVECENGLYIDYDQSLAADLTVAYR